MGEINTKLFNLYNKYFPELLETLKDSAVNSKNKEMKNFSTPLLMYCWEEEYLNAEKKVLYIGQETNSWYKPGLKRTENDVEQIINEYKKFNLSHDTYRSPFWDFINRIDEEINPSFENGFLWTNINKIGKHGEAGKPCQKLLDIEFEKFNILSEEIKILKPDCVIFLSGPNYDELIQKKLGKTEFYKCTEFDTRAFAQLKNKNLPEKSYRCYHPGYLQRKGLIKKYEDWMIECIFNQ